MKYSTLTCIILFCVGLASCSSPQDISAADASPAFIGGQLFRTLSQLISSQIERQPAGESRSTLRPIPKQNVKLVERSPLLFVPGDGGSQLEARLNKTSRVHYLCALQSDWFDLWLNMHLLLPGYQFDCFIDNMRLEYNRTTHKSSNSPGVHIRAPKFGSLDSVAYLDILHMPKTDYFENIIATVEKQNGYTRDVDMVAAPFDFRLAPNELGEFFKQLEDLIAAHYILNNYRPVTIVCHSMGCLNTVLLLNNKTQNWRDVYVRRLITLGAPWQGSFKAISSMLFGDNLGIPLLNGKKLHELQSSFPSLMYLFPREPAFSANRTLLQHPKLGHNISLSNLDEMFANTRMLDQGDMWQTTRAIAAQIRAPQVELWCLYGSGVDTPAKITYTSSSSSQTQADLLNDAYVETQGDGDGTVNLESLRACEEFAAQQEQPVYTRMFDKVDHIDILRGSDAAQFISTHILANEY